MKVPATLLPLCLVSGVVVAQPSSQTPTPQKQMNAANASAEPQSRAASTNGADNGSDPGTDGGPIIYDRTLAGYIEQIEILVKSKKK